MGNPENKQFPELFSGKHGKLLEKVKKDEMVKS
jgi:hypothetical protein